MAPPRFLFYYSIHHKKNKGTNFERWQILKKGVYWTYSKYVHILFKSVKNKGEQNKMENVQAKLDNFMRGVRGEKMDYVPIMMDFEPTYICEYTKQDCIRSFWDYDGFIKGYEQVMKDFDIDLTQSCLLYTSRCV